MKNKEKKLPIAIVGVASIYLIFFKKDSDGLTWFDKWTEPEIKQPAPGTAGARLMAMAKMGVPDPIDPVVAEILSEPSGTIRTNYDTSTMRATGMGI